MAVVIVMLIIHSLRKYLPNPMESAKNIRGVEIDPTRVADLPFDVMPTRGDPLSEAEMLWRAGRYDEAIVFLYGYMLLALDHARKIHLQKGKTNRMYLRELKSQPGLKRIVESTMLAFEDVFFGKHAIGRDRFELIWDQLQEFHHLLTPAPAKAGVASGAKVAPA